MSDLLDSVHIENFPIPPILRNGLTESFKFQESLEASKRNCRSSFELSERIDITRLSQPKRPKGTNGTAQLKISRTYRKLFIIMSLIYANFFKASAISLQAPFFPQEAEAKGATPTQYGFVFGINSIVIIIMSPVFGKLLTRVSPKLIIHFGTIIGGIACCVFGLLDYVPAGKMYLALAFTTRILEGVGTSAVLTSSFTIVAVTLPESRATNFAMLETAYGVGLTIGPSIGGALFQVGGFYLPFVINGGFILFGSFLLWCILPPADSPRQERVTARGVRQFLLDGGIIAFTLTTISAGQLTGFNLTTLEPHLRQFNLIPVVLGTIFVLYGGVYAFTAPIWGKICDKGVNPTVICFIGYTLSLIGLLFLGPVPFFPFEPTLWIIIVSLIVLALGVSSKLVSSYIGMLQNASKRGFPDDLSTYGMVSAIISTALPAGSFIGPSLGGFLLDTTGYRLGTVVIFILELFYMACLMAYVSYNMGKKNDSVGPTNGLRARENEPLLKQSGTHSCYG